MSYRRWFLTAALLATLGFAGATSQPVPPARPQPLPANITIHSLWIPAGNYTAIALTSNATQRRWIVSIKTKSGSFPVTIGPAQTVFVPFQQGWTVVDAMEARIESQYIPFEDMTQRNLLDGNELLGIAAWGISDRGPVNFVPPKPANK